MTEYSHILHYTLYFYYDTDHTSIKRGICSFKVTSLFFSDWPITHNKVVLEAWSYFYFTFHSPKQTEAANILYYLLTLYMSDFFLIHLAISSTMNSQSTSTINMFPSEITVLEQPQIKDSQPILSSFSHPSPEVFTFLNWDSMYFLTLWTWVF